MYTLPYNMGINSPNYKRGIIHAERLIKGHIRNSHIDWDNVLINSRHVHIRWRTISLRL